MSQNENYRHSANIWITWMIVLTLLFIFIPSGIVTSIAKSFGFPFEYVYHNFTGIGGIIRSVAIIAFDAVGAIRCMFLHHSIVKNINTDNDLDK